MNPPWLRGRLLVASPMLGDPNFRRTVVLLLEHSSEGAVGVVLNRPTSTEIDSALPEWQALASEPPVVFVGGPVGEGAMIGLAERRARAGSAALQRDDDDGTASEPVVGRVAPVDLGHPDGAATRYDRLRLFANYAGWGSGQLEGELDADAWFVVNAEADDVFSSDPASLWTTVLRRQTGQLRLLASFPRDPSNN